MANKIGKIQYDVEFKVNLAGLNQMKSSLQQLQKLKFSDVMKINESDAATARQTLTSIRQDAEMVEKALTKAFNTKLNSVNLQVFNSELEKSGKDITKIYQSFSRAGMTGQAAFRNLSTQLLSTNVQLRQSHAWLDKMAESLAKTAGWYVASSAVNSLVGSVERAWGYVKALDTSLNDIQIVTGKSANEMAKFAIQANNAAKQLGKTTVDYTNASLIYAQQGLSDQEIAARAAITLKTANVTGQSTDKVSEQLTAVWNGYKVNAQEAELYVDRLAAIAATTASDLEELSTGMSKVASAAATMGVSEEQLAAQLSTIISATKQAPESVGTALRTVYARISDIKAGIDEEGVSLGHYSGKMAELGFNVLDATGNLRDMGQVIEEIGGRWQGLTREQQISLTQTMAGQRQYNNLLALFDNFEKYNEALETAGDAAGTLQRQQDTYMESTQAHLQVLQASVEDIYNSLFNADAVEGIKDLIDGLSDIATVVAQLVDSLGGGIGVLKTFGAIGLSVFSGQIANGIQTTVNNLSNARHQMEEFQRAIDLANQMQTAGSGNEYTNFVIENEKSLLNIAKFLSPSQFKEIQNNLKVFSEMAGKVDIVQQKIQLLSKTYEVYGDAVKKVTGEQKSFDELLKDPEGINVLIEKLKDLKDKFEPVIQAQQKMKESFVNNAGILNNGKRQGYNAAQQVIKDTQSTIDSLKNTYLEDGTTSMYDILPQESRDAIDEASKALDNILTKYLDKFSHYTKRYKKVAEDLSNIVTEVNGVIARQPKQIDALTQDLGEGKAGKYQQEREQAERARSLAGEKAKDSLNQGQTTATYKRVTQLAAAVGKLGVGIQQVQNLGSIWKNENLTSGQKILQTVTNLTFSLPMLVTGVKDATTALTGLLGVTGSAWTIGIGAVIAGLTIGAAALTHFQRQAEEARKAAIEQNQKDIQKLETQKQQLQTQQKLYDSLQKLANEYEEHQISRQQLKSAVEDLIEQYGLQGQAADKLRKGYYDLREALLEYRKEVTQQKVNTLEEQLKEQQEAIDLALEGNKNIDSTKGFSFLGAPTAYNKQSLELLQRFNKIQGINAIAKYDESVKSVNGQTFYNPLASFQISYDKEKIKDTEFITQIQEVFQDIREEYKDNETALREFTQNPVWQALQSVVDDTSKHVKDYTEVLKDLKKEKVHEIAMDIQPISKQSISSVEEYRLARKQLRDSLQEEFETSNIDFDEKTLNQIVDSELSRNSRNLFVQYDGLMDKVAELQNKIHEALPEDVNKLLASLNPNQLAFIESLNVDYVTASWQEIRDIIEYISTADFSNLLVVTDPDAALEAATSQYDLYSSLGDQISSSKNKTINKKEFEKLTPEVQEFFTQIANGAYKMTGDAKEFYNTINNLSIDGFKKNISDLEASTQRLEKLQNIGYDQVSRRATTAADTDQLDLQFDYLTQSGYNINKIAQWQAHLADNVADPAILQEIADAIDQVGDKTEDFTTYLEANKDAIYQNELMIGRSAESIKDLKQLLDSGVIGEQAFTQAAIELDEALDIENLDSEQLEDYSDHLQEIAKQSAELSDELETNEDAAKIVAKSIMKMNDGVQELSKNWEDWSEILSSSSKESQKYSETMQKTQSAVADLLDVSEDYVSEDFIRNHLNDITAAAQGSEGAIDSLKSALAEDIIARIMLENGIDETVQTEILSELASFQAMLPDIEVGATIREDEFIAAANKLIQDCGMTVDQANAAFDALGFEANFKTQPQEITQRVPKTVTKTEVIGYESGTAIDPAGQPVNWSYPTLAQWSYNDGYAVETGTIDVPAMATNGKTPVINSLTRKPGGSFNNSSSKNATPSSKGGKGGGGKKGGSKAAKPDTSKKDLKELLEDERDIYHDINIELEQIDRSLDRVQKKQDRLYGKQLLDNLNEQSRILEQHKQTLKEKQKLQEEDLKQQRKTLKNLGVTFDKYGDISNYMSIMGKKQAEVNALIAEENSMIEAYNKQTNADVKKAIAEQIAEQQKKVKAAQDDYKDLQNKIKNYDETMKGLQDTLDQITEDAQKQVEINIQKFKMEVEIRLDMGQAERDWNKFRRQVLEHTDIIRDTDFHEIFNDALQNANDVTSYFDVHGSKGSIQMLTEQALRTRAQIEQINKTGTSEIYGDNKAQAMEDLQNYLDELMSQMEDVKKLIDDIDKAYLETIDDVGKQFDKQIEDYEFIGELIEHDMDLLSLLYGDKNYDAMNRYYETLEENNLKQLDSLKQQRDFWKQQWDAAMAAGDVQAAKQFEQRYRETIKNLNSLIEDSAKTIQDKYVNAIDKIFDELDKKLTNGKGTDYLNTEWELMNKNADEYLDTINSAFAIQETERKYQQALNDTKSIKNQQALKNLMDEQLDILKNKEKITQYDIDRAEKLLQVEQARIALEDAQSAKTSMRLKRDSQGNYSYEFAADEGAIGDAQANLAAAQNDLYNFDKDAYKSNLDDMLSAYQDFIERSKQLSLAAAQGDAEAQEKLVLLREQFGEYINGKTEQNLTIRTNLTDSALKDLALLYDKNVENYQNMSDKEKQILMEDLIPAWDGGIQQMINKVAGEGGFIPTIEQSFNKVDKATKDYQQELDGLADAAGISLGDVKNGVDLLANAFDVLVQANDDLIGRMGEELTAVQLLREQAQGLVSAYGAVYAAAAQAVTELHNFVQAEQGAAAAYAQTAAAYENMVHRIQQANADYIAHPYGGGYTPPSGSGNNGNDNSGGGTDNSGSGTDNSGNGTDNSGNQDLLKKNRRGNRGCFAAGTKIIMADQLVKNIEDIQVGDLVIAYNDETCTYEPRKVTKTFIHQNMPELVNIILSNGIILKITPGHPILTTEGWKSLDIENSWYEHGVQATLLKINDEILGYNGNTFVSGIHYLPFSNYTVYNLEVETCHTFLADGIVVHNVKVNDPIRLASGGYTGDWSSDEGKIAILHKRQQVFNEDDTQKLLEAVQILREITFNSSVSLRNRMSQLSVRSMVATSSSSSAEELQQTVSISATFPNVNSKREIEEALSDLVNLAAQRRMRRG